MEDKNLREYIGWVFNKAGDILLIIAAMGFLLWAVDKFIG